uniref:Exportin-5 n=1 Tax=Cacopsylla melanoneura TaxID=428564 RepID=A0A8D8PS84_9HEMI
MEPQDIPSTSNVLASLIQMTMDPMASQAIRLDAYRKIEDFKDNSPLCAQCGLFLVQSSNYSHIVRHTGIQLMEHCIKYRWYLMSQEEKVFIKESCVSLLHSNNSDMVHLLRSHRHTLDALSRIFVEMIKREWPQHWPNMFAEFSAICEIGNVQTELILYVFLRLSEDVVSLQTLESSTRRRDLCQQLNNSMKEIMCFFRGTLEAHVKHIGLGPNSCEHEAIVSIGLTTLSEYLEWIPPSNIVDNADLMVQLFNLIRNNKFQTQVSECLEKVAQRRGKQEEKMNLYMIMSRPELWVNIQATVIEYHSKGMATKSVIDFHKPLSGLIRSYTQLLTSLFSSPTPELPSPPLSTLPSHFSSLVEILLVMLQTKSLYVLDNVYTAFSALFKHPDLCKVPELVQTLDRYIQVSCSQNLVRKKTHGAVENGRGSYSEDDYMDEVDYRRHFVKIKTAILSNFKELTKSVPDLLFLYGEQWLIRCASSVMTDSSEWEALSLYLDCFMEQLVGVQYLHSAFSLINLLLGFSTDNASSYSAALSCLSVLFSFFTVCSDEHRNEYLPKVLDKVFTLLLFSPPQSGSDNVEPAKLKSVKQLRKHAGSLIVKLSSRYPSLLTPFFDTMLNVLLTCSSQLSQLQINCLHEALITINNHTATFEKQTSFIRSLLDVNNMAAVWLQLTNSVFSDAGQFIEFVGLHLPANEDDPVIRNNRIQIMRSVNLIVAILRRCRPPHRPQALKQGGYILGDGDKVVNPMSSHVLPLIPAVLKLINIVEQLHNPDHYQRQGVIDPNKTRLIHPDMKPAFDIDEGEKKNLLGEQYFGSAPSKSVDDNSDLILDKSPLYHMQVFLTSLYENLFILLGFVVRTMSHEVFTIPEFSRAIHENLLADIGRLPNFRLRAMVRHFVRHYVSQCPQGSAQDSVLLVFMNYFTTHMYQRINSKWESLTERRAQQIEQVSEAAEREEAVEEVIVLMMQREYMDVIRDLLVGVPTGGTGGEGQDDQMTLEPPPNPLPNRLETLSELGVKIARNKPTSDAILIFLIRCLSYQDTQCSLRTGRFILPLIVQLISDHLLTEEIVRLLFSNLLQGFHVHGEHDANQGALLILSVQLYTLLRPQFPVVRDTLLLIPNLNEADLAKFDEKILAHCSARNNSAAAAPQANGAGAGITANGGEPSSGVNGVLADLINNKSERSHKDMFKKLITNIVGKNVGQLFKCRATIKELPRIMAPSKKQAPHVSDDLAISDIAQLFN